MTLLRLVGALRLRRTLMALTTVALFGASAFFSEPAHAQPQTPPQAAWLAASVQTAAPADSVTFTASGFTPGMAVTFKLVSPGAVVLGAATAYGDGVAVLTVKVPVGTALGGHMVSASGVGTQGRALTVSVPLNVAVKIADVGNVALARTESNRTMPVAPAGLVAISGGALLLVAVRKRRARK